MVQVVKDLKDYDLVKDIKHPYANENSEYYNNNHGT
jgi:hypothetical protein